MPRGLSPEQLKKYLFGAKMVRCDETAWAMWGISMAGWNAILSGALAFVLASGVAQLGERAPMKTGDVRNPGDPEPRELVERTIRVDQAGEFGAVRIYEGQLAALRWTGRANSEAGRKIAAMARAEREHNKVFDRLLAERRVRPTVLSAAVERRGLRARRGNGADGRQGGDGLHGGDRGDDRRALRRTRPRRWATTRPSCAPPSRSSAPRRSSTRTRRSPRAPSRRRPTRR